MRLRASQRASARPDHAERLALWVTASGWL